MKRDYETTIVFDPNLDDAKVNAELEKVAAIIAAHGGSVKNTQNAGKKKMAYRVNNRDFGVYLLIAHDGENTLVAALERALSINENVLRHLVVKRDKLAPEGELVIADDFVPVFGDDDAVVGDGVAEDAENIA